jgi:hypothetical protein
MILDDESQVRAIVSFDKDKAEEFNSGNKSWEDKYLIPITGARHKGHFFDESISKFSGYTFFYKLNSY